MKKLLLLTASCLMLFACKKDNTKTPEISSAPKKFPVNFNISGFITTISPISSIKDQPNKGTMGAVPPVVLLGNEEELTKIIYAVFDKDGKQVSRIEQFKGGNSATYRIIDNKKVPKPSTGTYGALQDTLAAGTYTIMIACGSKNLGLNTYAEKPYKTSSLTEANLYMSYDGGTAQDVTYYKGQLVVGKTNQSQNILLTRIVGKVVVNFEDGFPTNTPQFSLDIDKEYAAYNINTGTPQVEVIRSILTGPPNGTLGIPNSSIVFYVLNTGIINFSCLLQDNTGNTIYTKRFTNVPVKTNQVTTLKGKAIPGVANGFTITTDHDWDTPGADIKF